MNEINGQVALARHREMVAIGLHQQSIESALAAARAPRVEHDRGVAALRQLFSAALRRVDNRLRGGQPATGKRIGAIAPAGQRGAA